jgi:hypothetical protein
MAARLDSLDDQGIRTCPPSGRKEAEAAGSGDRCRKLRGRRAASQRRLDDRMPQVREWKRDPLIVA